VIAARCEISCRRCTDVVFRLRVTEDSRYQIDVANGLRISNITTNDNGEYTCRAEVDADGRYDERKIAVEVHSKCTRPHSSRSHWHCTAQQSITDQLRRAVCSQSSEKNTVMDF